MTSSVKPALFRLFAAAVLALAGGLLAFLVYPAYAQASNEALAPSSLTAEAVDGGIVLNWVTPEQDSGSVTGYQIFRRETSAGERAMQVHKEDTGSTAATYTDSAVSPGGRYIYRVKALRGSDKSAKSRRTVITLCPWTPTRSSPALSNLIPRLPLRLLPKAPRPRPPAWRPAPRARRSR